MIQSVGGNFEGWVARLVDGSVLYESYNKSNESIKIPLAPGASAQDHRPEAQSTMDWKTVISEGLLTKIVQLELYFAREFCQQPMIVISVQQDCLGRMIPIQYKAGGVQFSMGEFNPQRTGILYYRVGVWDRVDNITRLWECTPNGGCQALEGAHPCWPQPLGFGIAPWIVGLNESEVPPHPVIT